MSQAPKHQRLVLGEGTISGALSIFLGSLSVGGVLCFLFPAQLSTPEFREMYSVDVLRALLRVCLWGCFGAALMSWLRCPSKRPALVGAGLGLLALAMGGAGVELQTIDDGGWHLSLDWLLLDLLVLAALFVPLELFWPQHREQTKFHEEWPTDLVYFAIGHLFLTWMAIVVQGPAQLMFASWKLDGLQEGVQGLPLLAQFLLAVVVADLFQYAIHRAFHRIPLLWRFHAIHHSIHQVDWLAGSRLHIVDIVLTRAFSYLPIYALGFSPAAFYAYVSFVAMQAVLAHANTRLPFGFLKHWVVTPQYHHWHHAKAREHHDKNFAIHLPLLDRLFGTHHLPSGEWPEEMGIEDRGLPKGFLGQLAYPFRPKAPSA